MSLEIKTNHRVDRIFRFVGYGTPLIILFIFVLFGPERSLKWTDGKTEKLFGLIVSIITLISVEALFILYALQNEVSAPIPLLSAQELRHRRVLTWASLLALICIVSLILGWAPSQEKCMDLTGYPLYDFIMCKCTYLFGLSPVYVPYGFIVWRLYRGRFRAGLNLAIGMGCAFVIPGVYLIRDVIRSEKVWWILGCLAVATLMQTVLVVVATKALIGMPRSSKWGIKSLESFAYGAFLFGMFWLFYSPVPNLIVGNEVFAMDFLGQCDSQAWFYSLVHGGLFPADFVASGSDSKCTAAVPAFHSMSYPELVAWKANPPDLSRPIHGYFFQYSGNDESLTKDGCVRYKRFTMTARPVVYGKTGIRSFLLDVAFDENQLTFPHSRLYGTSENRPATASDQSYEKKDQQRYYNPQ